jgi:ribulose-phosphate 3-epimerase
MNPFDAYKLDIEIIPGVLEQDWDAIEKKIELVKPFAKTVHIDLLDGKFAPNTTWMDPQPFKKYTDDLLFEVHLMVENPLQYLKPFADAGFKRFIGQVEHMKDIEEFIAQGELLGEVGLALDTETAVDKITVSYEDLDFLFVMTVKAGFSRQSFLPEMLGKVKQIRQKSAFIPIEIDGGVSDATIIQAKEAGATRFVSTGFLFGDSHPHEQYKKLVEKVS